MLHRKCIVFLVVLFQYVASQQDMCPDTGIDHLAHYSNCSKFFECDNGVKTVLSCPEEFVWNFWAKQCVYHDYISCFFTTIEPPITTPGPIPPAPGVCPSSGDIYMPNYGDCTSFYICRGGSRTDKTCFPGYSWNIDLEACDLTENVDCFYTTTYPNQTTTPKSTTTVTTEGPWTPDPICPYPSDDVTRFPHPYDCSMFYECVDGTRLTISCNDGYLFSIVTHDCELADTVDCSYTSITPSTTPTTTTYNPNPPTTSTPGPSTQGPWTPDPICPYPSDEVTRFPHPYDCSMFYECVDGTRLKISCNDGYLFSIVTHDCEVANTVDCSYTSPMPQTTTPMGNICQDQPNGTRLPHPSDCKKYVACENHVSIISSCPDGTSFDTSAKTCNKNNVNCQ